MNSTFTVYPAIDILGGKVVRLRRGRFDEITEYSNDPLACAQRWKSLGAKWLHVVDLDGARTGKMANIDMIKKIIREVGIPVQVGGGIRSEQMVLDLIIHKAARVVLGTVAVEDQAFLKSILRNCSDQVAVSLDCVKEYVMKDGWERTADFPVDQFVRQLEACGLKHWIYTDVAKDGMMVGPNFKMIQAILEFTKASKASLIASGGVSDIRDVAALSVMSKQYEGRLAGVIVGKSLYEGKVDFQQALEVCSTSV